MRIPSTPTPAPRSGLPPAPAVPVPDRSVSCTKSSDDNNNKNTDKDKAEYTVIHADLLIPGRGDPIKDAALAISDDKIAWVGPSGDLPDKYHDSSAATVVHHHVPVVMPGLWDVHVHYLGQNFDRENVATSYLPAAPVQGGAISVGDLRATLMAGYTSVRELGGYGGDLWPLVQAGALVGPNVYSAMAVLSISGGHGDEQQMPYWAVRQTQENSGSPSFRFVCDGVPECLRAVRLAVRRGARCIKVCSSGGVLSFLDDPEDVQFSDAELAAIVEEAGRSGRGVAAHAIGKAGIMSALRAGVRSIEHGMYLDDEAADLMLEKGAIFVGTHHVLKTLSGNIDRMPSWAQAKILALVKRGEDSYKLAIKKGVKMALGTDSFFSDPSFPLGHGHNAQELAWAVSLGATPLQAIEAATANAPETLARLAPLSGQLREGYDADVIALAADPLKDIEVITKPENITHVWKGGKLFKKP